MEASFHDTLSHITDPTRIMKTNPNQSHTPSCTPAFDDTAKGEGENAKLWAMGLFSTVDTPLAHKELLCEMMIRNAANH
jgi:hypothetical protein